MSEQKPDDRYIDIHFTGKDYFVNVRWCEDDEQHIVNSFDTPDEVAEFVREFYTR